MARVLVIHWVLVACMALDVVTLVTAEPVTKRTGKSGRRGTSADPRLPVPVSDTMMTTNIPTGSPRNQRGFPSYLSPERTRNRNISEVGCKELRSKRFISDGYCRSLRPLTEVVCSGHCLPVRDLPWYTDVIRTWGGTSAFDWRCVDGETRKRKVTLTCDDGTSKSFRVKVVENCHCKRVERQSENFSEELERKPRDDQKNRHGNRRKHSN